MKKPLYQALIEANVEESLAMKAAGSIPDDIATRADILEAENRSEKAFSELKLAISDSEKKNEKAIGELKLAISESEKRNEKAHGELKLAISESEKRNGKAHGELKLAISESEKKYEKAMKELAWKFMGFQTALIGVMGGIFVAAMKLL